MLPKKRSTAILSLAACLLTALTSCANSSTGKALEQSLTPDPNLKDNPVTFGTSPNKTSPNKTTTAPVVSLPADFPPQIPLYPNAKLQEIKPLTGETEAQGELTRWTSADSGDTIRQFYQKQFQENKWQIVSQTPSDSLKTILARQDNLQVKIQFELEKNNKSEQSTIFVIKYLRDSAATTKTEPQPTSTAKQTPELKADISSNIAPPPKNTPQPATTAPANAPNKGSFTDLNKAPAQLRQSLQDLVNLGVLTPANTAAKNKQAANTFEPNKTITRREYARWLVAANNKIYANQPARQIRLGVETQTPVFSDVPVKDSDFAIIQGLAEAGIIPSPLSGENTEVLFRPDAPLTREQLVLWKVPLDIRQVLSTTSVDAVQKTWGFQDAAKISPDALKAVAADFQNGDLSNIRRAFGYTTLFQPKKPVTRAEAGAALWYFGVQGEGLSAKDALQAKR